MNFCRPVIIRNQIYSQYNFTFDLPHQKTSIRTKVTDDQNDSPKLTTNTSINSTIVFYSLIPTTYFLPHRKTLITTKFASTQTFKTKRTVIPTSRKAEPHLKWQLHVHLRAIATITTATAYTPCLAIALPPRYHVSNLPNARGRLFYYQIWSVTDKQTNTKPEFIT